MGIFNFSILFCQLTSLMAGANDFELNYDMAENLKKMGLFSIYAHTNILWEQKF